MLDLHNSSSLGYIQLCMQMSIYLFSICSPAFTLIIGVTVKNVVKLIQTSKEDMFSEELIIIGNQHL